MGRCRQDTRVASIPMDQTANGRSGGRSADRPPVSAHPAFPAIVALWFASLFGLGSLILPVQLLERLLAATNIVSLIPSAAAPLGDTARAAIALAAGVGGAILGLFAARIVSRAAARRSATQRQLYDHHADGDFHGDTDFHRDASSTELPSLLGTEAEAESEPEVEAPVSRRRPLALSEEDYPSTFLDTVPLPSGAVAEEDNALELDLAYARVADEDEAMAEDEAEPAEAEPPVSYAFGQPGEAGEDDPLLFSPPSLARFTDDAPEPAPPFAAEAAEAEASMQDFPIADWSAPATNPEYDVDISRHKQAFTQTARPLASAEMTGLVHLVQKLGETLEKHRQWAAQRAAAKANVAASESLFAPEDAVAEEIVQPGAEFVGEFEPAPANDAAEAMAAWFGKSATAAQLPPQTQASSESSPVELSPDSSFASLGRLTLVDPVAGDDDDEDDIAQLAASLSLPLGQKDPAVATPLRDASYASLAAANPYYRAGHDFDGGEEGEGHGEDEDETGGEAVPSPVARLRPDAQPAPAPSRPASNDDSERALREALMNLQRMGK